MSWLETYSSGLISAVSGSIFSKGLQITKKMSHAIRIKRLHVIIDSLCENLVTLVEVWYPIWFVISNHLSWKDCEGYNSKLIAAARYSPKEH